MSDPVPRFSLPKNLLLAALSLAASAGTVELACRGIGHDFGRLQQEYEAWPVFYREPRLPVGEVFFRRCGPAVWQGRVLSTGLRLSGYEDVAYLDEAETLVAYDAQGFRNPEDLDDWELVVVGDSFVELGHLPHHSLYTTVLGRLLGQRVKNLGVSHTGPLSHVFYLEQYGSAPSATDAILVFYEGNDVEDLERESQDLKHFETTGQRPFREIQKQTSFVGAVIDLVKRLGATRAPSREQRGLRRNAVFESPGGVVPISTAQCGRPLRRDRLKLMDSALHGWANAARRLGLAPWLVFMPCKTRALGGRLRGLDGAPLEEPGRGILDQVHRLCRAHEIGFIDATPALVAESGRSRLTFNPIFDDHLNEHGSMIVAHTIAMALTGERPDPAPSGES